MEITFMTFNIIMLNLMSFFTGFSFASGHWIAGIVNGLCAVYWLVRIIQENKKTVETAVQISEETKEILKELGIKINVNGKEVI